MLTPQIAIVTQVGLAASYRGIVKGPHSKTKTVFLVVKSSPAEPSVNMDISKDWEGDPTFTVAEKGFVMVTVMTGEGGQTIRIYNDQEYLVDNKSLKRGQMVAMRVLRPGKHSIIDETGGAHCDLTVQYPERGKPLAAGKIEVNIKQIHEGHTEMDKAQVNASVAQALVFHVQNKTHIVTKLLSTTDRIGDQLVTKQVP